ncbi:MAG: hypothetical protein ACYTGG_07570 [Planctomycetota bacterium]|jgi:hypothetical protein
MADNAAADVRSQVFFMLISAGIFAYFGFVTSWAHQYTATTPPVLLPMVVLLKWTLRVGAVAFGVAALLSMTGSIVGPLVYALTGIVTAAAFVVVAVWEWTNPQGYFSGVPAVLLVIFAAWNGYGSWSGLQEIRTWRRIRAAARMPESTFHPPGGA